MPMTRCIVSALVLGIGLAVVVNDSAADTKKTLKNTSSKRSTSTNKVVQDNVLVAELQHIHHVLRAADPVYNGHRGRAMTEINHAIGALEKEMKARGLKAHDRHVKNVPRQTSHAMMAQAGQDLQGVENQIVSLGKTGHRTTAAKHVAKAVSEISQGLAHVQKKGR